MEVIHFKGIAKEIKFNLSNDGKPHELQLFRVGTFYDDRYGKIEITPQILLSMKNNFEAKVRGVDIALDYSHENQDVAAGWIKELELRNDNTELWGLVEYTEAGIKKVRAREFRYVSPEFTLNYQDNETLSEFGPLLLGAGLTNRPVIKGMAPAMALRELTTKELDQMKEVEKLKADLDATVKLFAELQEKQKMLEDKMAEMKPKEEEKKLEDMPKKEEGEPEVKKEIEVELKDKKMEEMSPEDMMKKIAEQSAIIADLQAKLQKQEQAVAMSEKEKAFDKLLSEGKACEAQRDAFVKGDLVKFTELQRPLKLEAIGHGSDVKPAPVGDVQDLILEKAKKFSEEKGVSLKKGISLALEDNRELAEKYKKETEI